MIVIIDYNCGNIASVLNMVRKAGGNAILSKDKEVIKNATKIILPGVGSFDHGISNLHDFDLFYILKEQSLAKIPILGICLGMQLLGNSSEEGRMPGLGLIDAEFIKFSFPENNSMLRVPHVGWNTTSVKKTNPILKNDDLAQRFYFVHSYYAVCNNPNDIIANTQYGSEFVSAYSNGNNTYGVQFHPEKSHRFGLEVIRNFILL
jgi:glutamine amidotransferase